MNDYHLLLDMHKSAERQGPGGPAETKLALELSRVNQTAPLQVADIVGVQVRELITDIL